MLSDSILKYHLLHNNYISKSCGYPQFMLDSKSFCLSLFLIRNLEVQAAKRYSVTNSITFVPVIPLLTEHSCPIFFVLLV